MDRHAWRHVGGIFLIALAARLGAAALWQQRTEGRFYFGDSETYWQLARQVARGEDYRYEADGYGALVFRTPGYPLLLAPLFLAGGEQPSLFWARAQGAVFGSLAAVAAWGLARSLMGNSPALAVGLTAAVYPGAVATSALILTEAPFSALMLVQLLAWTAAWRSNSPARAAGLALAAGAVAGAAVLVRPSWLLFTPMVVGLAWAARLFARRTLTSLGGNDADVGVPASAGKKDDRLKAELRTRDNAPQAARDAAERPFGNNEPVVGLTVLAAMLLVLAPWWVRNWYATGRFVPTTLQVGASLYDGLSPTATGASDMTFVSQFVAAERAREAERSNEAGATESMEVQLDRRMRDEAMAWAAAHPGRAARLALVKMGRMWNLWPNEPSFSAWPVRLMVAGTYAPLMALALLGAWRTLHLGLPYMLCWLPAVYFTLLHVVFVSSIRYREPPMLALMVLAAAAVFGPNLPARSNREAR